MVRLYGRAGRLTVQNGDFRPGQGDKGVEHADIGQDDLVSEFVWIRTASSRKRFYVRDPDTKVGLATA